MKITCPIHGEVYYVVFDLDGKNPRCGICEDELLKKLGFDKSAEISNPTFNLDEIKKRRFNIKK